MFSTPQVKSVYTFSCFFRVISTAFCRCKSSPCSFSPLPLTYLRLSTGDQPPLNQLLPRISHHGLLNSSATP